MRPAPPLLALAAAWLALGVLAVVVPEALVIWQAAGLAFAVLALADLWLVRTLPLPQLVRRVPASLPVGAASEVHLTLINDGARDLRLEVHDRHPAEGEVAGLPIALTIPAGRRAGFAYRFTPAQRGDVEFGACDLRLTSPFGLWQRRASAGAPSPVRIYPNFAALTRYALLATDNRLSQIGILQRRRRGEGMDFHQLREYRQGDSQRQIDWKATSRMRKLISREYRDERDQQIVFMIDCGRRMLASDADQRHLRHFDHVLNAALLLAYVSLRQGDAVGYMTFGTASPRFMAPRKTGGAVTLMLKGLYDVQPGLMTPDYTQAALEASRLLKRRALVVILSNLRDEDDDELSPALALLASRHLVLFASLREPALDETLAQPVRSFDGALTHAAALDYREDRALALRRVARHGAMTLDVAPAQLPVALVNRYLDIKRSGRL